MAGGASPAAAGGVTGAEVVWGAPGNRPRSGVGCSARQAAKPPSSHCVAFLLVIQAAKDVVTLARVTQLLIKILIDIAVPFQALLSTKIVSDSLLGVNVG